MKRMLLVPLALLATIVVAAAAGAATSTVQVTKNGFTPAATTVTTGDTVTWHNADSANHQVVANDGSFASGVMKPGDTFSFTFQKGGRVAYHDSFATTHRGAVTVNGQPASLTLAAATQTIVYGSNTILSGVVSTHTGDEQVTLSANPFGKTSPPLLTTSTQSNGAFSFGVAPTIRTTYQAHWRSATSSGTTIDVAPRVGFGRSGFRFSAKVTSDMDYAGHFVWLQRRGGFGAWHNVKRVYLDTGSHVFFHARLPHGRSVLRLVLPAGQAGPGYVQSLSRLVFLRR